ncbi:S-layer homology domain-containing protein [Geomicrobium sp. JCM 19039]|uniref:S-layer homology domain-containing protein n=1 Tax=Geomicrobium sp. JCM 19039 TaxID=1460636 RepID=UPI00045F4AA8|nr:S-layer homology domain-containing protein [Geomicrobium sp. JCM 19039]GAK12341.1 hypothetical protein JCM19039_2109 [Geomicrobium sp. JCM 19039]
MKRLLTGIMVMVGGLVLTEPLSAEVAHFDDHDSIYDTDSTYRNVERENITGYSDNTFRPNETIIRGQVANMLYRALDLEASGQENPFVDLSADSQYYEAAVALHEAGIFVGQDGGTRFSAGEPISRQQMASVLNRAFELRDCVNGGLTYAYGCNTEGSLADLDEASDVHQPNIEAIFHTNVSSLGVGPGQHFRPTESLTRSQLSMFLDRAIINENYTVNGIEMATAGATVDEGDHFSVSAERTLDWDKLELMDAPYNGTDQLDRENGDFDIYPVDRSNTMLHEYRHPTSLFPEAK